ncbi:putative GntR family transcriptional regulator [Oscillibacter valericigenes Sjm18-20]|nr:putative GntR family transcriptional regulator [Oscillibacter valericigenes Sjm18-20]
MEFNEDRPIFLQLADRLEEGILSGVYPEEGQVPSITEYSVTYKINPATALKGINLLVDAGLLYKKRGVGMFVTSGAREKLRGQRAERFFENFVESMVHEARQLGLTEEELVQLVKRGFDGDVD